MKTMMDAFGIAKNHLIIRTSSDCPEMEYVLEPCFSSNSDVIQRTKAIIRKHQPTFQACDQGLIFVPYLDQGQRIAKELQCQFYSGDKNVSDAERQTMSDNWFSGRYPIMVATAAFGAGNDCQHVHVFVMAGTPQEKIGFM
jgi:Superfamily II DNA helicase